MMQKKLLYICIIYNYIGNVVCWQYFTSLNDLTLVESSDDTIFVHSEYTFGDCNRKDIEFQAHVYKDHMEILGKIIVRGWLKIRRIPTCIILRATSFQEDMLRNTAYNFQICVPRITYCHSQKRFKYYYYEWYIPADMIGGMNWNIYFYGPTNLTWQ